MTPVGVPLCKQIAKAREERNNEIRAKQDIAAKRASAIKESCDTADSSHKYLQENGVKPHDTKLDPAGNLIVPLKNVDGYVYKVWRYG